MKIFISDINVDSKLNSLNIDFNSLSLTNEQIKSIINLKESMIKYNLDVSQLFYKILNFYSINECNLLILYVENNKLIHYLKCTFDLDYINNIEEIIYKSLNPNKKEKSYISERHEIYNDSDENKNVIERITGLNIDNIYCITINEREDRQKNILQQCSMLGLPVEFIKVKKNKDPVKGCLTSHIICVEDARNKGYENILILEDDANIDIIRPEEHPLQLKVAQAYQVIGLLLDAVKQFDSPEGQRALDYFSSDQVDEDFLPWTLETGDD